MTAADLVRACRYPATARRGRVGLWEIRRMEVPDNIGPRGQGSAVLAAMLGMMPREPYTILTRIVSARLHLDPPWTCVMDDSPREIRRHLPILLQARGRVLVTGLGLGCVVRGLLAKPQVRHVDVVEVDPTILHLVGPEFSKDPRCTLRLGDSETIEWPAGTRWDYAWHDAWTDTEPLDALHMRLLARYIGMAARQGAWQLDRRVKRRAAGALPLVNARRKDRWA